MNNIKELVTNAIELVALWIIVYGLWMIYEPLGFIGMGAGLLIISYGYTRNK